MIQPLFYKKQVKSIPAGDKALKLYMQAASHSYLISAVSKSNNSYFGNLYFNIYSISHWNGNQE